MYKSLICINTCNRFKEFSHNIIDYLEFSSKNEAFDLVVSLDGNNTEYLEFCEIYKIPLIYSEEREGVGISKNRVFKMFPSYDYYFFIEDDTILVNPEVFQIHIEISRKTNIHHFSLHHINRAQVYVNSTTEGEYKILHYKYGGAPFNFFTKVSLEKAGGWHKYFASIKRYGHTEHSYRIWRNELIPQPFNIIENLVWGYCIFTDPPSVTSSSAEKTLYGIANVEEELINNNLIYSNFFTGCDYKCNNYKPNEVEINSVENFRKEFNKSIIYCLKLLIIKTQEENRKTQDKLKRLNASKFVKTALFINDLYKKLKNIIN